MKKVLLKLSLSVSIAGLISACSTIPAEFQQPGTVVATSPSIMKLEDALQQRVIKPTSKAEFAKLPLTNCYEAEVMQEIPGGSPKERQVESVTHVSCTADSPKYVKVQMVTIKLNNGRILEPVPFHESNTVKVGDNIKVDVIYDRVAH